MTPGPLVLYDGDCGLCAASIQFILARERRPELRFAPLTGTTAADIRARYPWVATVDSLVFVDGSRVLVRSAAAVRLVRYLRWPWPLLAVGWIVPRPLRDAVYALVARHRHTLTRSRPLVRPAEVADRFLD